MSDDDEMPELEDFTEQLIEIKKSKRDRWKKCS